MGLFDFIGDIGNKIFGDEDDASEKVKAHLEEDNPGITNLQVEINEGVAVISGETESSSAYEKAILMAGNIFGISEVRADNLSGDVMLGTEYYTVEKGDTLWGIASKFYGNGSKYKLIFEENKEVIKDPDLIFIGQKIRIPAE